MEDFSFSFPITPTHSPIDSPPLWTLSPATSPGPAYGYRLPRKSSSLLESGGLINIRRLRFSGFESDSTPEDDHTKKNEEEEKEEEKMGMMWEAWNDELSKHRRQIMMDLHTTSSVFRAANSDNPANSAVNPVISDNDGIKKSNVKKKRSVLVLVKVLKKLFVIQQSAASKFSSKKRSR